MKLYEIAWAAGFVEGEGCIQAYKKGVAISVVQVDIEPLQKLVSLFGGKITQSAGLGKRQDYHRWQINGGIAIGAMFTLFSFFSKRRQTKIKEAVSIWKTAPGKGWRNRITHCPAGHELAGTNTKIHYQKGIKCRQCRICANATRMRWHYKQKERVSNAFV